MRITWIMGAFLGLLLGLQPWACKSAVLPGDASAAGDVAGSCLPHVLLQP